MATRRKVIKAEGQLRQGQLISTYGPGAMTDLPDHSVLISGLDFWEGRGEPIHEPRLSAKIKKLLEITEVELLTPPAAGDADSAVQTGVPVFRFPEWFVTQDESSVQSERAVVSRFLVNARSLLRGGVFEDPQSRKRLRVTPIRFVRACKRGHIGDINWFKFVHGADDSCSRSGRQLHLEERGTSGDLGEIWVRCACGRERSLAAVGGSKAEGFDHCDGDRPWLGPNMRESCPEMNRLLVRTASNSYFPQRISVISLPDHGQKVRAAVDAAWVFVSTATTLEEIAVYRRIPQAGDALKGVSDAAVLEELQLRRAPAQQGEKSVKAVELETLLSIGEEIGEDRPSGLFYARTLAPEKWKRPWMSGIAKVVLVQRLREVTSLIGFTRFEAAATDAEGELDFEVTRAALARSVTWVPTVENRGEGIFIQFDGGEIEKWKKRDGVIARSVQLIQGFQAWKQDRTSSTRKFPDPAYILLHTFSHLLMTAISLECGYPASSLKERIYAIPKSGYGVLIFTGSSDAEGTLGGLIEVGNRIADVIAGALQLAALCSNDPICSQHIPANPHERNFLLGAACHGCLLIAETSCEQQNDFLDRALVVKTVEDGGAEFFTQT
ncbi:DUF1998 domain-containing protein [Terriglobus roseus]|uniref:MrfA-like Zn-binding domain-containing protein n=1 Tax=Terriglobus roseus TaxID=392734 RepID=A0A1H4RQB0_9BACT|nr:DUF1998 domain-containing protein [Terriglobus roseus]SEC34105.1 protein of unknown function [Terriglobus roseus]